MALHGDQTTNNRTLAKVNELLGNENVQKIYGSLEKGNKNVLEIGCSQGLALKTLKEKFPTCEFYGMDIQASSQPDGSFTFLHQSIETSLEDNLKFDWIYSVATFPYVDDIAAALKNVARALKPNGKAIIMIEPFYLGPQGTQLFKNSKIIQWSKDFKALMVSPGNQQQINSIMEGFFKYTIPIALQACLYKDTRSDEVVVDVPAFYSAQDVVLLRQQNRSIGKDTGQKTINWAALDFLEVKTLNPAGPVGPGKANYRPFRFAALRVYLAEANLSSEKVANILIEKKNYDGKIVKKNYISSENGAEMRRQIMVSANMTAKKSSTCTFYTLLAAGAATVAVAAAIILNNSD